MAIVRDVVCSHIRVVVDEGRVIPRRVRRGGVLVPKPRVHGRHVGVDSPPPVGAVVAKGDPSLDPDATRYCRGWFK